MPTLRELISKAARSLDFRGHSMQAWTMYPDWANNSCSHCGRVVRVLLHPAPNEIAIYGSALAIHCDS